MGASRGETGPFACSCLPFPGPQRPIKGTLMEDDKRQPTPLLFVCASPRHSVCPPKSGPFFFFWADQTFLQFFPPSVWCPDAVELVGLKVGHDCALESWKHSTEQQRWTSTCVLWSAARSHQMAISQHQTSIIFSFHLQGFKSLRV